MRRRIAASCEYNGSSAYRSMVSPAMGPNVMDVDHVALIHPDFVQANLIASPDRGLVMIDWTGARRRPRRSLAFLLFAEGFVVMIRALSPKQMT